MNKLLIVLALFVPALSFADAATDEATLECHQYDKQQALHDDCMARVLKREHDYVTEQAEREARSAKALAALKAEFDASLAKAKAADEAREAEMNAKGGVKLGMNEDQVIASSWGVPDKINRTTTKFGRDEQWVYSGNYLYFHNGKLTGIQN